ncbi:hypothetical protein ACEWY4_024199 [Coilia grayii]|uniref:Protein kinase domain-containing protein n=1 Tax=Coilia grayii TaxID=363190 RepID=A0ABD1J2T2_9TELE
MTYATKTQATDLDNNVILCPPVHRHDGALNLKLADFGLALVGTEPLYTVCGTPTYVAPEILAETGYGIAVDVWAMGVILYILLCGFPPFRSTDRNQGELFKLIQAGDLQFPPPYWDDISEDVKDLIQGLLQVNPKKRLTAQETLQHSWIQSDSKTTDDSAHEKPQLAITNNSLAQSTPENRRLKRTSTPYREDIRTAKTPQAVGHETDISTDKTTEDEDTPVRMTESSTDQTNKHSSMLSPEEEKKTDTETSEDLTS